MIFDQVVSMFYAGDLDDFARHCRLVYENALEFNPPGSNLYGMALALEAEVTKRLTEMRNMLYLEEALLEAQRQKLPEAHWKALRLMESSRAQQTPIQITYLTEKKPAGKDKEA